MYIKLFQSYVYWLESRGRPPQWARITVAFALTAAALLNAVAALMLVQAVGGPRLGDWMADHSWVIWVAAVGFAFLHWLLGRRIPPADTGTPVPVTRVWWTSYMVLTLVLWVVASACTLVQMT